MSMKVRSASVVATALVAFALQVRADITYYVAPGGDGTDPTSGDLAKAYAHPQDAIDKATGEELVTVKIAAGTYTVRNFATEPAVINITKSNVSVEAISSGEVIIDGESRSEKDIKNAGKKTNCAVMVAEGLTGVSVRGIVFQNGSTVTTSAHLAEPYSSTLYAASGLFRDCRFVGKNFCFCSAMWLTGSSVASNCTFTLAETLGSTSYGYGDYAVAVYGQAKVVDSTLEELWRFSKAPIRPMIIGGTAVISNSVIRNTKLGRPKNFPSARGYGEGFQSASAVIHMNGGSLVGCTVTNLMAYGSLALVKVSASTVTIRDCTFWSNESTGLLGNNITVDSGKSPTIVNNVAPEYTDATGGNTSFEPGQEFCTSNSVSVGKAPFTVTFRNKGGVEATWDFGDGSGTTWGATPEHTYDQPGVYTVKMTVDAVATERKDYIVVTGPKMYVSKDGSGMKPYDTPAKAAQHPQDAVDLAPDSAGTEIEIDDGKYTARAPALDDAILRIQKSGVTVRAKNGEGHVWLDSQRTHGNGVARMNLIVGKGLTDVLVDSLVLTNGYTTSENGPSCALLGSGVFTNCTFDIYRINATGGVDCNGTARLTGCRIGSVAPSIYIDANYDYGLGLAGSSVLENSVVRGVNVRSTSGNNFSNPAINLSSANALIRNCLITGCKAGTNGKTGGRGAIAASAGTIENCTVVGNSVTGGKGGGIYLSSASVVVRNCIVWGNTAPSEADGHNIYATDYSGCTYSAATEIDATADNHNVKLTLADDPGFVNAAQGDYSLKVKTLLTGAGEVRDWMLDAVDLAGQPRLYADSVSMGAYEPQGRDTSLAGDFSVSGSNFGKPPYCAAFSATVSGGTGSYLYQWDFGDGTVTDFTEDSAPTHVYQSVGGFDVTLTVTDGVVTNSLGTKRGMVLAVGDICYLRPDQAGEPPYDTWAKATSNIEAAVALQPNEVLATNGTYYVRNTADAYGLKLDRAIVLRSVEGAEKTTIARTSDAKPDKWVEFHNATLSHPEAVLDGFSLTRAVPPAIVATAGLVKNCIVTNTNTSFIEGMVNLSGTAVFSNCVVDATGAAFSDTQSYAAMIRAWGSALVVSCELKNLNKSGINDNDWTRSGLILSERASARNCYVHDVGYALNDERPVTGLAGIYVTGNATADCCTVTRCWSKYHPGGGINAGAGATVRNCIVYGNTGGGTKRGTGDEPFDTRGGLTPAVFANNLVGTSENGELPEAATDCLPLGTDPMFVDSGYRLDRKSPCINAGKRLEWTKNSVDIEGNVRRGSRPDIGCWESNVLPGLVLTIR